MALRDNLEAYLKLDPVTGCLEWTRYVDPAGYGRVRYDGETGYVHRLVWEREHGPIPEDLLLRHKCDNPRCASLKHLELGTHADNAKDRDSRGRNGNLTHGKYVGDFKNNKYGSRMDSARARRGLTDSQVRELRKLRDEGFTQKQLGERFGISRQMAANIASGASYPDIV